MKVGKTPFPPIFACWVGTSYQAFHVDDCQVLLKSCQGHPHVVCGKASTLVDKAGHKARWSILAEDHKAHKVTLSGWFCSPTIFPFQYTIPEQLPEAVEGRLTTGEVVALYDWSLPVEAIASNADFASGSYILGNSPSFFHFDNESI